MQRFSRIILSLLYTRLRNDLSAKKQIAVMARRFSISLRILDILDEKLRKVILQKLTVIYNRCSSYLVPIECETF